MSVILGAKDVIRERLRVRSVWVGTARTPLFPYLDAGGAVDEHMAGSAAVPTLVERYLRFVISLLFQGNAIVHQSMKIEKLDENGVYHVKWPDLQIAPAAMPQIPEGSYDIENPVIVLEGGTNLYGQVNGNSIAVTLTYWDNGR